MPPRADLLPGTLDLLILKAVSLGSLNGYAIMQRIEQMTGGALLVEQGALYPALYRLEHRGLVATEWGTSENNRRAKFYSLTAAGRDAAEDRARQLEPAGDGDGERPRDPRPRGVRWWPPVCDRGCGACSRAAASSATWPTRWRSISQARAEHWTRQGLSREEAAPARPPGIRRRRRLQGRLPPGPRPALARRAARRPDLRRPRASGLAAVHQRHGRHPRHRDRRQHRGVQRRRGGHAAPAAGAAARPAARAGVDRAARQHLEDPLRRIVAARSPMAAAS